MTVPDFWSDKEGAQTVVTEMKEVKAAVEPVEALEEKLEEIGVLLELVEEEDELAIAEFERVLAEAEVEIGKLEFRVMLSGPDDFRNTYLSIHAGAGGTESCDWAEMLLRMYTRWAERSGYEVEAVEMLAGDGAGIRRATVKVNGRWAYGYLKAEVGVHRLVRISPFDANKRRHTSFASVDVLPQVDENIEIDIKDGDIRVDTYRASGAGGQHVNKTSSAVRITHLPTGIVVQCQNERSQHRNRRQAMDMLKAKLYQMKQRERDEELMAKYDEKGEIAWGNQIRSYVLQPYTLIKDTRTGEETGNVQAVLDGDIDRFIHAYLKLAASDDRK